ncbi:MAG TPA: hypothetical protein VG889_07015 [Rhizomicrobium sp.]|nr:hypothetical protein [Rhizomicrobium sp.]
MKILRIVLVAAAACSLSGCFDLDQKVSLDRGGAGRYQVAISAKGAIGEALKDKKGDTGSLMPGKAVTTVEVKNGNVVKTARVDFRSLAELKLENEEIAIHVLDHGFLGVTPSHVRFRHSFFVGNARARRSGGEDEKIGKEMMASLFGDHTYSFSVTLPGSVDRVAPVKIGGVEVKPEVTGDFYHGHTIVWRMPLPMLFSAQRLDFEVDFSALGSFADASSKRAKKS